MNEKLKNYIYTYYSGHDDFESIINFFNKYDNSYHGGSIFGLSSGIYFSTIVREFYEKENYRDKYFYLQDKYEELKIKNEDENKKLNDKIKGLIGENKNLKDKIKNKDFKLSILFKNATEKTIEIINELIKIGLLK